MTWQCPECKFVSSSGGLCPCSDYKSYTVTLVQVEDDDMVNGNIIKPTGDLSRYAGQKTAKLLYVAPVAKKSMHKDAIAQIGGEEYVPNGTCLYCIFIGDKSIAFIDVRNYGSAAWRRMEKLVGHDFIIEWPMADAAIPVALELSNDPGGLQ